MNAIFQIAQIAGKVTQVGIDAMFPIDYITIGAIAIVIAVVYVLDQ